MKEWDAWPVCDGCWAARYPGRRPYRLREPDRETCAFCGQATRSGIYERLHRSQVHHPGPAGT